MSTPNFSSARAYYQVRYTYKHVPAAILAVLSKSTVAARIAHAVHMIRVARDPSGRFGLDAKDLPDGLIGALEALVAGLNTHARPFAIRLQDAYARTGAWDTAWEIVADEASRLGYGPGDSDALIALI